MKLDSKYYYNSRIDPENLPEGKTLGPRLKRCEMCGRRPPLKIIYENWLRKACGVVGEADYLWVRTCGYCDDLLGLF